MSNVRRLQPSRPCETPVRTALSIIDAITTAYSPTGLVAFYHARNAPRDVERLATSLAVTLSAYPFLAGQLQWAKYDPSKGHQHRYRRLEVIYGTGDDPGVELAVQSSSDSLATLIPTIESRREHHRAWDGNTVPFSDLVPDTQLALQDAHQYQGLPAMIVQITTFADGGLAIAAKIAHPLADAHALTVFMRDWTSVHRSQDITNPLSGLQPFFDPSQLDARAAGDLDAHSGDPAIIEIARSLPLHRYDQWASKRDAPFYSAVQDGPEEELSPPLPPLTPATLVPWHEWDVTKPCASRLLHFTSEDVDKMYKAASDGQSAGVISRHDALVAYIWASVAKARGLQDDDLPIYVDMSLGLRKRFQPPLPENSMGSPVMMAATAMPANEVCVEANRPKLASKLKDTWAKFNATTLPAVLHDAAFEACPTRLWGGFLGQRHVMLTSWVHSNPYNLVFEDGKHPDLVRPLMPACDGLVVVVESGPSPKNGAKWYEQGIDVELYLEAGVMDNFLGELTSHSTIA